ncbi:MAG: hypothetical protein ACI4GE_12740 [Lachnospiraceae bacterium]|nr:ABC transporter permease [Eubacteriales bacterium]
MRKRIRKEEMIVPATFILFSILCFFLADVSLSFLVEQVSLRFIRNIILILALIFPIMAGMGLNFAVVIGTMITQAVFIFVLNFNITGAKGAAVVLVVSLIVSAIIGSLIGHLLNKVKGKEMVTSIVVGFLANYIYQLIFVAGFGTVIHVYNEKLVLSTGIGVKNMVDLKTYKEVFDSVGVFQIGEAKISVLLLTIIVLCGGFIYYLMHTPFGQKIKAVGMSEEKSANTGIDVDRTRIVVIILSTMIAALGQFVYLQNIGSLNVYTEHLDTEKFACAALLAGGASIRKASVRNAFVGVILLHTLFILSPLAGRNAFSNASLGEYFRSFLAYGIIAFALVVNLRLEQKREKEN